MRRQAEIKCKNVRVAKIAIGSLLDWHCSFAYNSENNHLTANISEAECDILSLLMEVEFTEPTDEELAKLEEEANDLLQGHEEEYFDISPITIEFNHEDIYGETRLCYADVEAFVFDKWNDICLCTSEEDIPLSQLADKVQRKELLEEMIKVLSE